MWPITNNLYKKLRNMSSGSISFGHISLKQILVRTLFKFVFFFTVGNGGHSPSPVLLTPKKHQVFQEIVKCFRNIFPIL